MSDVQVARRIAVALITSARTGSHMSYAEFVSMAEAEGITSSEGILRLAIRVAYFEAEIVAALLKSLELGGLDIGDAFVQGLGLRVAQTESD